MLLSLLDKMDEQLEALFDWAYRRLWLEVAKASALHKPSVRPRLEALEDRLVLDAYTFIGGDPVSPDAWSDTSNWLDNGAPTNMLPGANDDVTINAGTTCNLSGQSATVQSLTLYGTLNVQDTLTVAANGNLGSGTTLVDNSNASPLGGAGTMTIGSSNSQANAKLDTNTFTDDGTVTVGGPDATGSSADLDAAFLNVGDLNGVGLLNIGDPGAGHAGSVDVSNSMVVSGGSALNVGGVNGSGGSLDVVSFTSGGPVFVNTNGEMDVKSAASFFGTTTVAGGEIKAENINDTQGAAVDFAGSATVSGTGKLSAEINASFTVDPLATLTLLPDSATGGPLNEGRFIINGTLAVDTNFTNSDAEITLNDDGGATTAGSITGTGSIDWWNTEFEWTGGLIAPAGGFTIDDNSEFKTVGANPKTLGTDMKIIWPAEFGGAGSLTITSGNTLLNTASAVLPIDVSLPLITGAGLFDNAGAMSVNPDPSTGLTIASVFTNELDGTIDCETAAGPLALTDTSGASVLNGKLFLNNDSLTISGTYTTTASFDEDWSPSDLTTLTGTLIVDSGASADFDHMVISGGATVTGPGDFSIGANGGSTGDYLTWSGGTMSGTGTTTIGPYATLSIPVYSTDTLDSRTLDNHGNVSWAGLLTIADSSGIGGPTIHNEKDGTFHMESSSSSSSAIPTFLNDGMLEVESGVTMMAGTFTQSSTGTLQSDIASSGTFGFGVVSASGTATLDGTLQANLENGYQPPSGTMFKVLTFASSSGQFADVKPDGWTANYDPTDVTLVSP